MNFLKMKDCFVCLENIQFINGIRKRKIKDNPDEFYFTIQYFNSSSLSTISFQDYDEADNCRESIIDMLLGKTSQKPGGDSNG